MPRRRRHDIVAVTVKLLQDAGDEAGAYALVRSAGRPRSFAECAGGAHRLEIRSARLGPPAGRRGAAASRPRRAPRREIEVDLALGRITQAVSRAEALHAARPTDQHATALLAVAWRLAGDARYTSLYDYDRLVKAIASKPPQGWNSLDDYLRDLGNALDAIHGP